MQKPKLTKEQIAHAAATGEADEYLAAHSEIAPVYAPGRRKPRYDVFLDAEAADELFRQCSDGKGSLQTASVAEIQAYVDEIANQLERRENPWIGFLTRSTIIISIVIVFIVALSLIAVYAPK